MLSSAGASKYADCASDDSLSFSEDEAENEILRKIQQQRLQEMKASAAQRQIHQLSHGCEGGKVWEMSSEKELVRNISLHPIVVCHFYKDSFSRCRIIDAHLVQLSTKHPQHFFCRIDAEKAPFFASSSKTQIRVLPTLLVCQKGAVVETVVGFDEFGCTDNFKTEALERRLFVNISANK